MMIDKEPKRDSTDWADFAGWAAVVLTALFALLTVTVQWGVVNARLDGVEKQLSELVGETRATRNVYAELERRIAFIEGLTFRAGSSHWDVEALPK